MECYGPIETCSMTIFSFLNLHELQCQYKTLCNKVIHKSIIYLIQCFKTNTLLYRKVLHQYIPKSRIYRYPILELDIFKSTFSLYLFSLFDKHNITDSFFLINKLDKCFFVKKIKNRILFLLQRKQVCMYYVITCETEHNCGYLYREDCSISIPQTIIDDLLFLPS